MSTKTDYPSLFIGDEDIFTEMSDHNVGSPVSRDAEISSVVGHYATTVDMNALASVDVQSRDDKLSDADVAGLWNQVFNVYKAQDTKTQEILKMQILLRFILEGTSSRAPFQGSWNIGGQMYPKSVVRDVIPDIRRFARSHADVCHDIAKTLLLPTTRTELRQAMLKRVAYYGYDESMAAYAFDFAGGCSITSPEKLATIERTMRRFTRDAQPSVVEVSSNALKSATTEGGNPSTYFEDI